MFIHNPIVRLQTCLRLPQALSCRVTVRHASLNSAIGRGLRKSRSLGSPDSDRGRTNRNGKFPDTNNKKEYEPKHTGNGRVIPLEESQIHRPVRRPRKKKKGGRHEYSDERPEPVKEFVMPPRSIPYTTPASEFIYGANVVEAALRCSRRQFYRLYIYQAAGEDLGPQKISIRKLALTQSIPVKIAFGLWDRLFDQASQGRPHNGCVLEASHLPRLPVKSLGTVTGSEAECFPVSLDSQSREEAAVNGTNNRIPILPTPFQKPKKYPLALLLDGILDPGNLGAIIRSAYYLGVDAVIFAGRNSAPLSPVAIKSSAGAAENMIYFQVRNEVDFIKTSKANGWRFYAADAPGPGSTYIGSPSAGGASQGGSPLNQSPSVLMLGSEGAGLSNHIRNQADSIVSIPGARNTVMRADSDPARVDSLNVSVAAALLMEKFLPAPAELSSTSQSGEK